MGFRVYIGKLPKKEYNKIKSLTKEGLVEYYKLDPIDEDNYIDMRVYDFGEQLYEFGKYVNFEPPKGSMLKFFKKKELHDYYNSDNNLAIVTSDFLKYVIEQYYVKVKSYYENLLQKVEDVKTVRVYNDSKFSWKIKDIENLTEDQQCTLGEIVDDLRHRALEWTFLSPFNLDTERPEITTSWFYEYSIFELVRIYKTFDWKKDVMYFYGY